MSHSAVRDHSELCSTNVDINNFKVLANSSSEIDLKILESLHIFKSRPRLNRHLNTYPLLVVNSYICIFSLWGIIFVYNVCVFILFYICYFIADDGYKPETF